MEVICVTGVPGTGKTTLAKKLAKKLNFYYLDVNKFIEKNKLPKGYDRKRKTKIIDVKKLNKILIKEISRIKKGNSIFLKKNDKIILNKLNIKKNSIKKYKKIKKIEGIIIDSHLSHYLPRKYVDFCIVTKCDIKELNKRLKKKKFHQNKIMENIQAEIFNVCLNEARERKHKIITVDTAKVFNISSLAKKLGG